MHAAHIVAHAAAELALFSGVGFLLFGLNDLAVDAVYFGRRIWRSLTVYKRHRRAYASYYVFNKNPGFMAIFVPAWEESEVIAPMLRTMVRRLDYDDYRIFVGHYRNDPATAAAITSVADERIVAVRVEADGPTTKAHCLNQLYDALIAYEIEAGHTAKDGRPQSRVARRFPPRHLHERRQRFAPQPREERGIARLGQPEQRKAGLVPVRPHRRVEKTDEPVDRDRAFGPYRRCCRGEHPQGSHRVVADVL